MALATDLPFYFMGLGRDGISAISSQLTDFLEPCGLESGHLETLCDDTNRANSLVQFCPNQTGLDSVGPDDEGFSSQASNRSRRRFQTHGMVCSVQIVEEIFPRNARSFLGCQADCGGHSCFG